MPVSKQMYSNRGRVVSTNKKSIFKKIIDKGIDALSKLERKYIQGIDYEDDPLFKKERDKQNKKEHDELFGTPKAYGGKAKMMGGGKVHMKKYAKGGGMRKAMYK